MKPNAILTIFFRLPPAAVQTVQTREAQKRPSSISVTGENLPKNKKGADRIAKVTLNTSINPMVTNIALDSSGHTRLI